MIEQDGYKLVHFRHLTSEERVLAEPMLRYDNRVLEHRLVCAKELGRSLTATEVVHHKDLSRDANNPKNLELRTAQTHPTEHAAIPRRAQKELTRLYDLLDENGVAHRKQLLRHLPWEYQEKVRATYGTQEQS